MHGLNKLCVQITQEKDLSPLQPSVAGKNFLSFQYAIPLYYRQDIKSGWERGNIKYNVVAMSDAGYFHCGSRHIMPNHFKLINLHT